MRFENPYVLWLLLVVPPALLLFLWWASRTRQRLLAGFIQARLLPDLTAGISTRRRRTSAFLFTAAVALGLIALARPQWGFTWEETKQKGLDVVVAIDTSKSMLAEDIAPNRLARAKLAALELMQLASTDRLGLVAFAGTAFLQCPMTFDEAAFRQTVEMLDVNTLPQGGTALAEAITTATTAFKEDDNFKALILFTDGEDQDSGAIEAAKKAAEAGLRIFTIGVGSAEGELLRIRDAKGRTDYIKDDAGNVVKSRLNESLLRDIATAGGGFYLPLRGAKVIETLYEKGLAPMPKSEAQAKLYQRFHEQFHWPLAAAILLLVVEFLFPERRHAVAPPNSQNTQPPVRRTAIIALVIACLPLAANASPGRALKDFRAGKYDAAQAEYERLLAKDKEDARLAYNAGAAAYRNRQFETAIKHFDGAVNAPDLHLQQRAYHNRGNSRFQLGEAAADATAKREQWERSLKDFDSARKLDTQDADANANYEFVKQKLEELKQQEQQQQQQNQQDQDKQDKQDQSKQDPSQKQDQPKDNQQSKSQDQQQQKNSKPEQPEKGDQQQPQDPKQDQSKPAQDQAQQKPSDQGDPSKPGESGKEAGAAQAMPVGQMTPEQAQRVLDMQKGDEKVLPVQLLAPQPAQERKLKDW